MDLVTKPPTERTTWAQRVTDPAEAWTVADIAQVCGVTTQAVLLNIAHAGIKPLRRTSRYPRPYQGRITWVRRTFLVLTHDQVRQLLAYRLAGGRCRPTSRWPAQHVDPTSAE